MWILPHFLLVHLKGICLFNLLFLGHEAFIAKPLTWLKPVVSSHPHIIVTIMSHIALFPNKRFASPTDCGWGFVSILEIHYTSVSLASPRELMFTMQSPLFKLLTKCIRIDVGQRRSLKQLKYFDVFRKFI